MVGHEGTFSGSLYQAVAASVFLFRNMDRDRNSLKSHLLCHIIAIGSSAYWADKGVWGVKQPHHMGNIVGTAAESHSLRGRADIFLGFWKMINMKDDIQTGGANN